MEVLFPSTRGILAKARQVYGAKNQILVSIEELCELASVCAKYPRYTTHEKAVEELREHVLEEMGDVLNALDHIQAIFGITYDEAAEAAAAKGDRVARWLSQSNGMEITTTDRAVGGTHDGNSIAPCRSCAYEDWDTFSDPCMLCVTKPGYQGYRPAKN